MAVLANGLETVELGRTAWREVINQNFVELDAFIGSVTGEAVNITTDTTNFNGNLSVADTNVQLALDTLDNLTLARTGRDISLDTTNFDNNLSRADTNVQLAMETLDELVSGGLTGETTTTVTKLGDGALTRLTSGLRNTASGVNRLSSTTIYADNTAFGFERLKTNNNQSNNTAIGSLSQTLNTGSTNTTVGTETMDKTGSGYANRGVGFRSIRNISSGFANAAIGRNSLGLMTTQNNNSALGDYAGYTNNSYSNCTFLGANTRVTASNQVQLGDASTTTYAYGRVQDRSDRRDKKNINLINEELAFNFINKLKPSTYQFNYRENYTEIDEEGNIIKNKNDGSKAGSRYHAGLIAQEVKEVMDDLNFDFAGYQDHSVNGGEDVLSIGYQELIPYLISTVQTLTKLNNELFDRVEILETSNGI